jgi:hypothetical protein
MGWLQLVFNVFIELLSSGALFASFIVQTNIHEDSVEPGVKGGPAIEIAEMRVGAQKCLLRKVLGFLAIARKIERNSVGFLFVPLHEFLERLVIAASG